jgi:hypothetical protein
MYRIVVLRYGGNRISLRSTTISSGIVAVSSMILNPIPSSLDSFYINKLNSHKTKKFMTSLPTFKVSTLIHICSHLSAPVTNANTASLFPTIRVLNDQVKPLPVNGIMSKSNANLINKCCANEPCTTLQGHVRDVVPVCSAGLGHRSVAYNSKAISFFFPGSRWAVSSQICCINCTHISY